MKPIETPMLCKKCGMLIGYQVEGKVLIINGLIIKVISGACMECGTVFHYSMQDEELECLLKKIIDRRQAHDNAN